MLHNLDTFKVKVISAVCKAEGITEAARELRVTPSAVSQCIKNVEKDLKKQLFIRVGKKLLPNEFTLKLVTLSAEYFGAVDELLIEAKDQVLSGHLKIGGPHGFGENWITPKLSHFLNAHSQAKATLNLDATDSLIEDLLQNKLDIIFVDGDIHLKPYRNITSTEVHAEDWVLCCSKKYYRELRGKFDYKSLIQNNHVLFQNDREGTYKWYKYHFGKAGEFPCRFTVNSAAGILAAVREGFGLGVVPYPVAAKDIEEGNVVVIEGKKKVFRNRIFAVQLSDKIPSKLEKEFLKSLI